MKELEHFLLEYNRQFKEKRKEFVKLTSDLVSMNYDTQGLYQQQLLDINQHLQQSIDILELMIDTNDHLIKNPDSLIITLDDGTVLDYHQHLLKIQKH